MSTITFIENVYFKVEMPYNEKIKTSFKLVKFRKWIPGLKVWLFNKDHFDHVMDILTENKIIPNLRSGYLLLHQELIGIPTPPHNIKMASRSI